MITNRHGTHGKNPQALLHLMDLDTVITSKTLDMQNILIIKYPKYSLEQIRKRKDLDLGST